jgi:hypothetical protein
MWILRRGYLKKTGSKICVQIFKDCFSKYPEQDSIKKIGGHQPQKKITLFELKDVETSKYCNLQYRPI